MIKICVVTGARAEYGLLYWTMKAIQASSKTQLSLCVTGMHLSPEFGMTFQQIEEDGFEIDGKVEMLLSSDTSVGITKSMGLGLIGFADFYKQTKPDWVLVLGDRYEILSAVTAAMMARIPIAHCHGGETTEGVIDEAIRHSITKMSHVHFTSTNEYKNRVIQLGEDPKGVFNIGALGIENINRIKLLSKLEFEKSIKFNLAELNFLVTFHPVTLEKETAEDQLGNLLLALENFPEAKIIFTKANADNGGRMINDILESYVKKNPLITILLDSLGQTRYLSAIKHCQVVIGNSSSGLIEVPSFKKPTVNIGDRQKGRVQAESVISCGTDTVKIRKAIHLSLSTSFRSNLDNVRNPYGSGNASEKIVDIIIQKPIKNILKKKFYDLDL